MKKLLLKGYDLFRIFGLPIIAIWGLFMASTVVRAGSQPRPAAPPVVEPASANFESYVSGSGLVEARPENLKIASHRSGVISEVLVKVGDVVDIGQPLFRLDTRDQNAMVGIQEGALAVAVAQEKDAKAQLDLAMAISDKRAMSIDDLTKRKNAYAIAQAKVEEAKSSLDQAKADLDLLTVTAPRKSTVLKVDVRPGEFAPAQVAQNPLIVLGDIEKMWVRVDIDENDAWRVSTGARATASLRGNKNLDVDLSFVRIEPYVIPKKYLTGDSTERVDTRVLQVIYEFEPKNFPVYVGQLMDVFIEAKPHE